LLRSRKITKQSGIEDVSFFVPEFDLPKEFWKEDKGIS